MPRRDHRLRTLWTFFLAASCAAMTVHPEHESDPFWHMSLGRSVLAHARRTIPEPLALPAFDAPAVVPEWLWGVITYELHRWTSWRGLVAFIAILAVVAAVFTCRLVDGWRTDASPGVTALVTGLVMGAAMGRLRLRPEAVAVILIPAFLLLAVRYVGAEGVRRLRLGLAACAIEVLWAQLHGSFVLAPVLFAMVVAPRAFRERGDVECRRAHSMTAGALLFGLLTSAYGADLSGYLVAHAHGDAVRHIDDMAAPAWSTLDPAGALDNPYGIVVLVLWGLGGAGMLLARRVFGRALLLALVGGLLALNAVRFLPLAPLFMLPLAVDGASEIAASLPARPWRRWLGVAVGTVGLVWGAHGVAVLHGPFGVIGPAEGGHPQAAAAFLSRLPSGGSVLSVYNAGGLLGYTLAGRARTYVDARTPLYFDETDFAVARDVFSDPDALRRAIVRYGATAVVINRNAPACAKPPAGWGPAVVEAHYTTFVPVEVSPALQVLAPCGADFLGPEACAANGSALDDDVRRLSALDETSFVRYVRAERIVRCGGALADVRGLIPSRAQAKKYLPQRDALEVAFLLRTGDVLGAVGVVEQAVREGDRHIVAMVAPKLAGDAIAASRARTVLEDVMGRLDDGAPPDLRALLALACAADDDVRCTHFHGLRAAARGSRLAIPALVWLREHDTSRGRADAAAWLSVLANELKDETTAHHPPAP